MREGGGGSGGERERQGKEREEEEEEEKGQGWGGGGGERRAQEEEVQTDLQGVHRSSCSSLGKTSKSSVLAQYVFYTSGQSFQPGPGDCGQLEFNRDREEYEPFLKISHIFYTVCSALLPHMTKTGQK